MRTPLQILFLILVTDLPPSIALGMEPGHQAASWQRSLKFEIWRSEKVASVVSSETGAATAHQVKRTF